MSTRWQPDTCDGFVNGSGCIIEVEEWGVGSLPPTGVVVQRCARHAALADAHLDNIFVSQARALCQALPSLAGRLIVQEDGSTVLPDGEMQVRFENNSISITLPHASLQDKIRVQASLNVQFPGKGIVS